jgi:hypothetical protein
MRTILLTILGALTAMSTQTTKAQSNTAMIEAYVDQTITYVDPTPIYTTDTAGNTTLSGYSNTHAEQRERAIAELTANDTTPSTEAQTAMGDELANAATTTASTTNRTGTTTTTTTPSSRLGRGDLNGDGTLSDSEVTAMRQSRVSMRNTGSGTKLDADGDRTVGVNEASATRNGRAWDGDNDGAVALEATRASMATARAGLENESAAIQPQINAAERGMRVELNNAARTLRRGPQ